MRQAETSICFYMQLISDDKRVRERMANKVDTPAEYLVECSCP